MSMMMNPRQADEAARRKTAKPTRYIPAGASGAARSTQTGINEANIAAGRTPGALGLARL